MTRDCSQVSSTRARLTALGLATLVAIGCSCDGQLASTGCGGDAPDPVDRASSPSPDTHASASRTDDRSAADTGRPSSESDDDETADTDGRTPTDPHDDTAADTDRPPRDSDDDTAASATAAADTGNPYDVPVDTPELRSSLTDPMREAAERYLNRYFSEHHLRHRGDNVFTIRLSSAELAPENRDDISSRPVHVFRLPDASEAPPRVVRTYRRLLRELDEDDGRAVMVLIATGPRDEAESTLEHLHRTLHPYPARGRIRVMYTLAHPGDGGVRLSSWHPN